MAKKIIRLKIDVSKIDKERLFKGTKGTYLDATLLLNDEADQYDNHGMIVQDIPKEEREAGGKGTILGNARIMGEGAKSKQGAPPTKAQPAEVLSNDDLPF